MAEKFVVFVVFKSDSTLDLHALARDMQAEALQNSACHHYEYHVHDTVNAIRFDEQWEQGFSIGDKHQHLVDEMLAQCALFEKIDQSVVPQ